jgi:hypothetical protein
MGCQSNLWFFNGEDGGLSVVSLCVMSMIVLIIYTLLHSTLVMAMTDKGSRVLEEKGMV